MARITRIATWKREAQGPAVLVEVDGKRVEITHLELSIYDTETKIKTELETRCGKSLPNIYVHKNRDGTLAAAAGIEPVVWPEDFIEEKK